MLTPNLTLCVWQLHIYGSRTDTDQTRQPLLQTQHGHRSQAPTDNCPVVLHFLIWILVNFYFTHTHTHTHFFFSCSCFFSQAFLLYSFYTFSISLSSLFSSLSYGFFDSLSDLFSHPVISLFVGDKASTTPTLFIFFQGYFSEQIKVHLVKGPKQSTMSTEIKQPQRWQQSACNRHM